jgi:V8-like Glu-specific endopeptidase
MRNGPCLTSGTNLSIEGAESSGQLLNSVNALDKWLNNRLNGDILRFIYFGFERLAYLSRKRRLLW